MENDDPQSSVPLPLEKDASVLEQVLTAAGVGVFEYDAATGTQRFSQCCKRIWGLLPDEVPTLDRLRELLHAEDRHFDQAVIESLRPDGSGDFAIEYRIVRPDGTLRWIQTRGRTEFSGTDSARQPLRSLGVMLDITERKHAEELQRRNAATFHSLIQNNPFGIYVIDADFRLLQISKGASKVFANVHPLLGRDFEEVLRTIWPEPFATDAINRFRQTLVTGEPYQALRTIERRADIAETEAYDWRVERIVLPDDRWGVVCYFYDLSEREHWQQQLKASADRLRSALAAAQAGTFDWNVDTGEVVWSGGHYTLLGLEPHSVPATYELWRRHVHPEDIAEVELLIQHALTEGTRYVADYRVIGKDGLERWIQGHGLIVKNAGTEKRMVGTIVDITERKGAEAAVRLSERRFRVMADGVPAIIWVTDAQGEIEFVNREYCAFFGVTAEQVQKTGLLPLLHHEDVTSYSHRYKASLESKSAFRARGRVRHASGEWRWVDSSGVPRFSDSNEFLGHVGLSADVTEIIASQEALQNADRRKDEFLATLAHELRNPLAPIRTAAQILGSPKLSPQQLQWAQEVIQRQVKHMGWLLDDLLDVARITQGKLALTKEAVLLTGIVDAAVEVARPLLDSKNHRLLVQLPAEALVLYADPLRLAQVVANLLTNAAKYTDPDGHIELSGILQSESLCLSVKDNGIGIPAGSINQIFEMFSQVDSSSVRSGGGLGIGLALVKGLVNLHGGEVEVRSEGPNCGSEFLVHLPLSRERPAVVPMSADVATVLTPIGRRVLVADDNKDAADSLAMWMGLAGHEVRVAYDGLAALSVAQAFRPDVAIVDIGMPKCDGYEVARKLRCEPWGARICLVALTGWGQDADRRRTKDAGFDHHMTKPIDPDALEALLSEI